MSLSPLTPDDLDLRDFPYMPLDAIRLRDSDMASLATGDEFRAAVLLWCAAWHQVPAASLPTDDRMLAKLAGYGRDVAAWGDVKDGALRGFVECSDGRLYHPVIADKAIEAGEKRKRQNERTLKATEARRRAQNQRDDDVTSDTADDVTFTKEEKERKEVKETDIRTVAEATRPGMDLEFEEFWKAYPRRDGSNPKFPSQKKFKAFVKSGIPASSIIAAAKRYAAEIRSKGQERTQFVMQAETWLNKRSWGDYTELILSPEVAEANGMVRVKFDTPQWTAWVKHRGGSMPMDKQGGWWCPSEYPPVTEAAE